MRTLLFRPFYLLVIIGAAAVGDMKTVTMHVPLFLASLVLLWLARRDKRLYALDAYVVSVLALSILAEHIPVLAASYGSIGGFDKLFHALGGFGAAWGAFLLYERRIREPAYLFGAVVMAALAVGAAWEVFEWVLWLLPAPFGAGTDGYTDAMLDLVADTVGALLFCVPKAFKLRKR